MTDHRPCSPNEAPPTPERLIRALAALAPPAIIVPSIVDDAILQEASRHLRTAAARPAPSLPATAQTLCDWMRRGVQAVAFPGLRRLAWAGAAAGVMAAGWLALRTLSVPPADRAGDFNRDGRVDILDALALAQEVQGGTRLARELDFNRDGVVDRHDADAIALRAVSLDSDATL
ncbi:MAG: hypothetical protein JXQ71_03665 [Verrucomicrobia bacterium]|nr:hypothetical protein [Verrucomicrobiota bacterium]